MRVPFGILAVVLALVLATGAALAAQASCDNCGALNAVDAARCAVCGQSVKKAAPSPSPKASLLPPPTPLASTGGPPPPVPSVKSLAPDLPEPSASPAPDLPEPTESPEPAESPAPRPTSGPREEPREKGNLVLESVPAGATVRLRTRAAGVTPLRRALEPGTYRITLVARGHQPERLRLRIQAGETVRRMVRLTRLDGEPAEDEDASDKARMIHADHQIGSSPSPAPSRAADAKGTLSIELVKYGDHTTASTFAVEIDGKPSGEGKLQQGELSSRLVRTFRYQRTIAPGPHRIRLTLLGVPTARRSASLEEVVHEFDVELSAGRNTTLFHTWAGGIEDFSKTNFCCTRGHRKP